MIKINTKTIENELVNLNDYLESYYNLANSIYFEFQSIFSNWQNSKGEYLKEMVLENKTNDKKLKEGIERFISAIRISMESYQEIGSDVSFSLDAKDFISDKYTFAIDAYNGIIDIYNSIPNLALYPFQGDILSEKETLQAQRDKLVELKGKTDSTYDKMLKIEDEFKGRLDGFDLITISQESIVEGNNVKEADQYYFKNDEIEPRVKLISLLVVNNGKNLQNIKIAIDTIVSNYDSSYTKKMNEMKTSIISSLTNSLQNLKTFNDYTYNECNEAEALISRNIKNLEGLVNE